MIYQQETAIWVLRAMKTQQAGTPGKCSDAPLVLMSVLPLLLVAVRGDSPGKAGKAARREPRPGVMQRIAAAHAAPRVEGPSARVFPSHRKQREK